MSSKKYTLLYAVVAVLFCAVVAGLALNAVTLNRLNEVRSFVEAQTASGDPARENDVSIGGEYEIRSTTHISDAYKSGSASELSDKDKEILDMASSVLEELITPDMSDYEKELAVYDWMTSTLCYDTGALLVIPQTGADSDNPYGVLKYHDAVCVGYATTFRLFMQMMDIECMVVHNSECYHSWDLVKLEGEWYHTDIYSDAGVGNYSHLNLSDAQMGAEQTWNRDFFPKAEGYEYNYAYQNRRECQDIYEIPMQIRNMIDNCQGAGALEFEEKITEERAQVVQIMLEGINSQIGDTAEYGYLWMNWSWLPVDGNYILSISINGFESEPVEPDIDIPEEEYDRIFELINNAFGDLEPGDYWDDEVWAEGGVG